MPQFGKRALVTIALALLTALPVKAEIAVTSPDGDVHAERYAVTVNGTEVSSESTLYLSDDGTLYASASDLGAWKLEYPLEPSFTRDGTGYYGLQTLLHLAVAVIHPEERLEIVAPRSAFIGQPDKEREPPAPGGGTMMNYRVRRTDGTYDLFFARNGSVLQTQYVSRQSSDGIALLRVQTRWYHLDLDRHRVFQIGDGDIDGSSIGSSLPFAGLHVASEFAKDPLFVTHDLPSVRGIASSPSLVEVYVNDVLQWREEVPAGAFTVRDLPASAANSDVMLVLFDRNGNRTVQIVRPTVDQEFLRPGLTSYSFDAGVGRVGSGQPGAYYRDGVASLLLRRGITNRLTAQFQTQDIAGKDFTALGAQVRIGSAQLASVSYGIGAIRRAAEFDYRLRAGKLEFHESLRFNAERSASEYDPYGIIARFNESADVRYSPGEALSLGLRLDRAASNSGSASALLSMEAGYRLQNFEVMLRPSYDKVAHVLNASLQMTRRFGDIHSITESVDANANQHAAIALDYRKTQRDPDDPWTLEARSASGQSDERRIYVEDRMPWATATVLAQDQNGRGILEPSLSGSLALVGNRVYALRNLDADETIGVVHLPQLPNVRIKLNGADAGRTDKNGDLVLRHLAALEQNEITADISNVPIAEDVKGTEKLVPFAGTPVSVDLVGKPEQTLLVRIVDAAGQPLPPASWISAETGARTPVGFDGRVYIRGIAAGTHTFTALGAPVCRVQLTIAARWEIVDSGTVVCR